MSSHSLLKFFSSFRSKGSESHPESSEPVLSSNDRTAELVNNISDSENDRTLIAVISAAVAMMMSEETGYSAPYPGFRVRRIRRFM